MNESQTSSWCWAIPCHDEEFADEPIDIEETSRCPVK